MGSTLRYIYQTLASESGTMAAVYHISHNGQKQNEYLPDGSGGGEVIPDGALVMNDGTYVVDEAGAYLIMP